MSSDHKKRAHEVDTGCTLSIEGGGESTSDGGASCYVCLKATSDNAVRGGSGASSAVAIIRLGEHGAAGDGGSCRSSLLGPQAANEWTALLCCLPSGWLANLGSHSAF